MELADYVRRKDQQSGCCIKGWEIEPISLRKKA